MRGKPLKNYMHKSLGVLATLGIARGVFQSRRITITGFAVWLIHRGYRVLAMPTWERKIRVATVWLTALLFGLDIASLTSAEHPRKAFVAGVNPIPIAPYSLPLPGLQSKRKPAVSSKTYQRRVECKPVSCR
jgi:NADH:quinone reductase (non-electrogenic)